MLIYAIYHHKNRNDIYNIEYIRRKTRLGTDHLNISAVISDQRKRYIKFA